MQDRSFLASITWHLRKRLVSFTSPRVHEFDAMEPMVLIRSTTNAASSLAVVTSSRASCQAYHLLSEGAAHEISHLWPVLPDGDLRAAYGAGRTCGSLRSRLDVWASALRDVVQPGGPGAI